MNDIVTQVLTTIAKHYPAVIPHLSAETLAAVKAGSGYPGVRSDYWHAVHDAVYDYLTGNSPVTSFMNSVKRAFTDAYIAAAEIGYQEGGADLPFDEDTLSWLTGVQAQEFGYIEELFARLKEEWEGLDPAAEAASRAEGYVQTLDAIFGEAKVRAAGNKMLTLDGDDGKESCPECKRLKGQRHRASWWIKNGLVPAPGNANYTCGNYNCDHRLYDDDGNEYTI